MFPVYIFSENQVTAVDYTECACCGGWMITLSENPAPYEAAYYQWDKGENEFTFIDDEAFPIYVRVKLDTIPDTCAYWIDVLDMELID